MNLRALIPLPLSPAGSWRSNSLTKPMQTIRAVFLPAFLLLLAGFAQNLSANTVSLQSSTYSVSESAGSAAIVVLVTRDTGNQDTITVSYTTADGTVAMGWMQSSRQTTPRPRAR